MPEEQEQLQAQDKIEGFIRHENFESWYSNNIQFHPSEYDLKLIFGEIDWPPNKPAVVQQHTAISMSWLQAKLMLFFLSVQVGVYELLHGGAIAISPNVAPNEPDLSTADDPVTKQIYELIKKKREELMTGKTM